MKIHWIRGKEEINEIKYCPYCGCQLEKIEGKSSKICPEGCLEITFSVETIKVFSETIEE